MTRTPHPRMRFLSRLSAVSILTLGLVVAAGIAPTSAAPGASVGNSVGGSYVALGDSFTAGQGASPSLDDPCLRSATESYPAILASTSSYRDRTINAACSAASTGSIPGQIASVDPRVAAQASLVTITVGGIDAGVAAIVAACGQDAQSLACQAAFGTALENLPDVGTRLAGTYAAVAAAFPRARIHVLTYPRLFDPGFPDPVTAATVNGATDALNQVIAGAVVASGQSRVSLVDVTARFAAHGIGSSDPWIAFGPPVESLHPNAAGNAAYAAAVREVATIRGR
ncbi:SGNH/GDSL hydrolase family protein [Yonghaparkia sp. Soil809]|uniref:SGNH/GDSL hydrolase family protein n=1 Tax=Yonghaparkia sp. Soil809 TaxID=1736417 RepID=UPI0009E8B3A4|nr:SGNH/GDSL hydrolase family protein [Yonghaparkia sp. Soil809]